MTPVESLWEQRVDEWLAHLPTRRMSDRGALLVALTDPAARYRACNEGLGPWLPWMMVELFRLCDEYNNLKAATILTLRQSLGPPPHGPSLV